MRPAGCRARFESGSWGDLPDRRWTNGSLGRGGERGLLVGPQRVEVLDRGEDGEGDLLVVLGVVMELAEIRAAGDGCVRQRIAVAILEAVARESDVVGDTIVVALEAVHADILA